MAASADVLVPHLGLMTSGTIGAQTAISLDEAVQRAQAMHDAATEVNPDILVLCHGGPIALPEDAAYVLERTRGVVGFFGASSMERLPTEIALTENMRRFTGPGRTGMGVCGRAHDHRPRVARSIKALAGSVGSSTLRALSAPATGSAVASSSPNCTSTEA